MRIRSLIAFGVILLGFATLLSRTAFTQAGRGIRTRDYINGLPVADGEILVRLRSNTPAVRGVLRTLIDADDDQPVGHGDWHRFHSSSRGVQAMLLALAGRSDVLQIEPNYIVQITETIP